MMNEKQLIRKKVATHKQSLSNETKAYLSQKVCFALSQTEVFQKARCVALYYSMDDEVQTVELINEWYERKNLVLPTISGKNMNFHTYTGMGNTSIGALGITEPVNTKQIQPEEIDLIIVPGVAFDHKGNRIGRGKGFYDRFLSKINNTTTIGICFGFQLMERIPAENHDIKMDMVITEDVIVSRRHQ